MLVSQESFPQDPELALKETIKEIDESFIDNEAKNYDNGQALDNSSSSASIVLIVDEVCFTVNVGTTKTILS